MDSVERKKMEKDEVVQVLCKKGYQAVNDRGVILIYTEDFSPKAEKNIRSVLSEIGYNSSFGIVGKGQGKAGALKAEENTEGETEEVAKLIEEPEKPEEEVTKSEKVSEPEEMTESEEAADEGLEDMDGGSILYDVDAAEQLTFQW